MTQDGYDFNVSHQASTSHGNTDGLSRLMCHWNQVADAPVVMWLAEKEVPELVLSLTANRAPMVKIREVARSPQKHQLPL